jgi:cobalt-zinc-cadmium efflux system outer membrane protein
MFRFFIASLLLTTAGVARPEPLSLDAALELARRQAPDVAVQTASVAAAEAAVGAAGRLPDPKLIVAVDNLPVSGADQWSLTREPMTMRKVGLMQDVPNGARRRAEADIARAGAARAQAERRVRLLEIQRDTALAWLGRYFIERRGVLLDALQRENKLFADTIGAQLAAGRALPADALAPRQEAAEIDDRRDELAGAVARSKATLRRWVGVAGDEPLAGEAPEFAVDAERLRVHVHEHPEIAVFVPMTQMAQAEVHAAEAAKRPDWGVELGYGRRGAAFGDMVSLQFTVGLPLFAGTRQNPLIVARRQALDRVEAERATMLRDHQQDLEANLIEYDTLSRQLERMRDVRLPLARQKVDLQFASYRGGRGELGSVIGARRELIELELRQLELEGSRAAAAARLYYIYGEGAQ